MKTRIRVVSSEWSGGYEMLIAQEGRTEEDFYVGKLEMEKVEVGAIIEPTLTISRKEIRMGNDPIQGLMDNLWQLGLRPSNGVSNAGQLQATQDHLKDMQKISFDFLNDTLTDRGKE